MIMYYERVVNEFISWLMHLVKALVKGAGGITE